MTSIEIRDRRTDSIIFGGALEGKIKPSETYWAIGDDDPMSVLRGKRLIIYFTKMHQTSDLWASVLSKTHLEKLARENAVDK